MAVLLDWELQEWQSFGELGERNTEPGYSCRAFLYSSLVRSPFPYVLEETSVVVVVVVVVIVAAAFPEASSFGAYCFSYSSCELVLAVASSTQSLHQALKLCRSTST